MLLDAGCSPNLTTSELMTPLHIAAKKGFPDVAEQLVQAENIDLVSLVRMSDTVG
jgi:ankyrin repeat protein